MMELVKISYSKIPNNSNTGFDVIFDLTVIDESGKSLYKSYKLYGEHLALKPINNEQLNSLLNKFKLELLSLVQDELKLIDKLFSELIDDLTTVH